jgi:cell division transport system permease protein
VKFNPLFFLRESLRSMRRNTAPTFAALATITVTLVVIGIFIPIVQATRGAANDVRGRVLVNVYEKTDATKSEVARVGTKLEGLNGVRKVVYESKAQALAQQKKENPLAYGMITSNPLPDTYHVYAKNPSQVLTVRSEIEHGSYKLDSSIQNISNQVSKTRKLLTVTSVIEIIAGLLALLLMVASLLLIANTIRLSLYARRREVEVMKLVGATDWFIRWPFVIEGVIVGTLGAVGAVVMLGLGKVLLVDRLFSNWSLVSSTHTIPYISLVGVLLLAGILVSAMGSGLSLRRFLRV